MNLRASFGSVKLTVKIRAFEVQSFLLRSRSLMAYDRFRKPSFKLYIRYISYIVLSTYWKKEYFEIIIGIMVACHILANLVNIITVKS